MSSAQRNEMRHVFFECYRKWQARLPLEPLEVQLVEIILAHPEYHELLANPENIDKDHLLDENPFFHMSLHLTVLEQVHMDRPAGIKIIYEKLCEKNVNPHEAQHVVMDCLTAVLWEAQQKGVSPDERSYIEKLTNII